MKKTFQLPEKKTTRFHLWVVLGSFIFTLIFEFLSGRPAFSNMFLYIFVFMLVQIELFAWIGGKIFNKIDYSTIKEFVNRVLKRLAIFYLIVLFFGFILFVLSGVVISLLQNADPMEFIRNIPKYEMRGFIVGSSVGLLIGSVIFFLSQLIQAIKRLQKLNEEKLAYQYQTLKNQVNPHFLFNSLNTLSSIVYKDAKLADQFIQKLSACYRYILDHNETDLVSIDEEVSFVKEYFYLQKLRGNEKYKLEITDKFPPEAKVLPISIQLLVENAIKHNAATNEKPLVIEMINTNEGYVIVRNNRQPMQIIEESHKTGLKNLGERVKHVSKRELTIEETSEYFSVNLPYIEK